MPDQFTDALFAAYCVLLLCFVCIWPISVLKRDASIVDLLWPWGFVLAGTVVWIRGVEPLTLRGAVLLGLVCIWAARLGALFVLRKRASPGEDPRYAAMRRGWGRAFWWKSLFVVFALQATLAWILALPLQAGLLAPASNPGALGWFGVAASLAGLAIETVADAQMQAHRRSGGGGVHTGGLWGWSRHPNYFGEWLFWTGIWMTGGAATGAWWTIVAPALLLALLLRVSGVPMLEAQMSRRPGFDAYRARVPAFWPRPPRRDQ